jgi:lysophospholipase
MAEQIGKFESFDGKKLFYRYFSNPEAENTLILLHGHGEHSGRYQKFEKNLASANLSIATYDFRGHGQSEGPRVYIESFDEYVEDVSAFVKFMDAQFGLPKKFLFLGHSFGGLTAVNWAMRHPERIRALFLSSPCLGLRLPSTLVQLNRALNQFSPKFVYQNPVYPPHLTHNVGEIEQYKKDPYIQRKISVRLIHQILEAMKRLESYKEIDFPFPVFILAAGLEKVVDFSKTKAFYEKLKAPVKELKVFDNFYHEIFNELEQEKVFDVLKLMIQRCKVKQ